ncbi:BrnT family toxin [Desulfovibrio sp. OttesenSCG-928-M16]|nr:BrnT family toxin [Desulfovibrio sp. OttesenSCG-928-M16]
MKISIAGYDWDSGNWPKCGKHGVTKEEIEEFFASSPSVMPDPHPDEPRIRAIGKTKAGRYLFIVFMFRLIDGQTFLRPISARYMHQKEVEHYEESRA